MHQLATRKTSLRTPARCGQCIQLCEGVSEGVRERVLEGASAGRSEGVREYVHSFVRGCLEAVTSFERRPLFVPLASNPPVRYGALGHPCLGENNNNNSEGGGEIKQHEQWNKLPDRQASGRSTHHCPRPRRLVFQAPSIQVRGRCLDAE